MKTLEWIAVLSIASVAAFAAVAVTSGDPGAAFLWVVLFGTSFVVGAALGTWLK